MNTISTSKVFMATGHRPNAKTGKLGTRFDANGFSDLNYDLLVVYAMRVLKKVKPVEVISGMALGWDQAVAQAAVILGIPVVAAVPFPGQEAKWPHEKTRQRYNTLLKAATRVHFVSREPVQGTTKSAQMADASRKLHLRNEWMVQNTQAILALHDGTMFGGTYSCLEYAKNWAALKGLEPLPVTECWTGWEVFLNQIGPDLDEKRRANLATLAALPTPAPADGDVFVDDDTSDPLDLDEPNHEREAYTPEELAEMDAEIHHQMVEDAMAAEDDQPF